MGFREQIVVGVAARAQTPVDMLGEPEGRRRGVSGRLEAQQPRHALSGRLSPHLRDGNSHNTTRREATKPIPDHHHCDSTQHGGPDKPRRCAAQALC